MIIPELKKIKSEKKYHNTTLKDDYSWVDQPDILDVLKKTLPVEIIRNSKKLAVQNLSNTSVNDFLDFGQENVVDFDNSINSLRGCCSFGTGHLDSFMNFI